MANYTYEQRQMIAEYLENEILPDFVPYTEVTLSSRIPMSILKRGDIEKKIKTLKQTTFGDIKNQVGVRFEMVGYIRYRIIHHSINNTNYILDESNAEVYPLSYLNDTDQVEVIND